MKRPLRLIHSRFLNAFFKKSFTAPLRITLIFLIALPLLKTQAQTLQFSGSPVTAAVENFLYTGSIQANISNNDPLTYSASVLPSWLTLSSAGMSSGTKINNTIITQPGGVARDENGNYYVVPNNGTIIYKVLPDGTTSVWAAKGTGYNYGAIVVDNFLYVSYYSSGDPNTGIQKYDLSQTNPVGQTIYNSVGVLSMTYKDGYLYGANYAYAKVVRIKLSDNTATDYITGLTGCFGLGFDPSGNLMIASYGMLKVWKYNTSTSTLSDAITGFVSNNRPSDVKIDAQGYLYVSLWSGNIRKYLPDYSSYTEVTSTPISCWSMTMTPTGALIYGDYGAGNVYSLQTGVVITGTPSHNDVGVHPVKITVTNGTITKDLEFNITVTDPNAPVISGYSPAVNAVDVPLATSPLTATFSETIVKGTGNIYIKNKSTDDILETIDVTSNKVTIADNLLSIAHNNNFPSLTSIYITVDAGAVKDVNNNNFAGISASSVWYFKSIEQTQAEQTITFASARTLIYGTADTDPAASSSSELEISYTSSDASIASIVNGKIHIKKTGTVTITATQAGNDDYFAAAPVEQELIISTKEITVTINAITKVYGTADPAITYSVQGLLEGDHLTGEPVREEGKNVGEYTIHQGTLSAGSNYSIEFTAAKLGITKAALVIKAESKTRNEWQENPVYTFTYTGLSENDSASDLITLPNAQSSAVFSSPAGKYDIKIAGASSSNYTISYNSGVLTVKAIEKKSVKVWSDGSELHISIFSEISQKLALTLYTATGQAIQVQRHVLNPGTNTFTMPIRNLASHIYILNSKADRFNDSQRVNVK
jgi:hypothetical protein